MYFLYVGTWDKTEDRMHPYQTPKEDLNVYTEESEEPMHGFIKVL